MIVTLTTDFGEGSPYVAAMKGVILALAPETCLVDITHAIPPQDIRAGALALAQAAPCFPPGTLHVAVVDPGVGSARQIVYVELLRHAFICPDNGLLSRLADRAAPSTIRAITNERLFRQPVSATFHGRDVMAPVAAHLSRGLPCEEVGPLLSSLVTLDWPGAEQVANKITGRIESIDSFGNLITNITGAMLAEAPRDDRVGVFCDEHETRGIFRTYADQPPMTLVALLGSDDRLELAIVNDSAALMLGVRVGTEVELRW